MLHKKESVQVLKPSAHDVMLWGGGEIIGNRLSEEDMFSVLYYVNMPY